MTKNNKLAVTYASAGLGNAAGIFIAIKRKSGFWGGVGWFLLGGFTGLMVAGFVVSMIPTDDEKAASLNISTPQGDVSIEGSIGK